MSGQNKYRAVFISDVHLGSKHCQAKKLIKFLESVSCDTLFIVGDLIDNFLFLEKWTREQRLLLQLICDLALKTEVIYIPGNHDCVLRNFYGTYGNIRVVKYWIHLSAKHQLWRVTHGDETDMIGLNFLLRWIAILERFMPIAGWEVLRLLLKKFILNHTQHFEAKMLQKYPDYEGVICGHIHFPKIDHKYMNCGDWVQHCSAIVERHDGTFELACNR